MPFLPHPWGSGEAQSHGGEGVKGQRHGGKMDSDLPPSSLDSGTRTVWAALPKHIHVAPGALAHADSLPVASKKAPFIVKSLPQKTIIAQRAGTLVCHNSP